MFGQHGRSHEIDKAAHTDFACRHQRTRSQRVSRFSIERTAVDSYTKIMPPPIRGVGARRAGDIAAASAPRSPELKIGSDRAF